MIRTKSTSYILFRALPRASISGHDLVDFACVDIEFEIYETVALVRADLLALVCDV